MKPALFSCFVVLFFCVSNVFAEDLRISSDDVAVARGYLFEKIPVPSKYLNQVQSIRERAEEDARACKSFDCAYTVYVEGIYKSIEAQQVSRKCPVSEKMLEGEWSNKSGVGYYETISLSEYKGKPSVHQFLVFKGRKSSELDDGFGGWGLIKCVIKTKETVSSGGRVFNPGNDLSVVAFDKQSKMLTILDGAYLVEFQKKD